jgi:hypothetical protein
MVVAVRLTIGNVYIASKQKAWNGICAVLLGVWVPGVGSYWVCGWQERGVTGCVGPRSEAFQLLLNGLEFWVLMRSSKTCSSVNTYKLEYFNCNKSRFSIRINPLDFPWAPPLWSITFLKPLPPSPTHRHKTVARITPSTSSAILIA